MKMKKALSTVIAGLMLASTCSLYATAAEPTGSTYTHYGKVTLQENVNGPTLGVYEGTGVDIIEVDGLYFKDLNRNGELDLYEDWRESSLDRAKDLAGRMSTDRKLGLMMHNSANTQTLIQDVGMRFNLTRSSGAADTMAETNNQLQYWAESDPDGLGIPVITSTDPRHTGTIDAGTNIWNEESTTISRWPNSIAMGQTFDEEILREFGDIVSAEYRAIGIQMQLGPQMDLITDPRWNRAGSSYTEDLALNADLSAAFIESMQTDPAYTAGNWGVDEGWGSGSVATMAKHWPSGGNGEFGFDGHTDDGKFGVYPGDAFEEVANAFAEGAGFLEEYKNTTRQASSVMPYYTIAFDQDPSGLNVANAFSKFIVQERLRDTYNYDGMVCTDWQVQAAGGQMMNTMWGLENGKGYTPEYRILMTMLAGVDQQGGFGGASHLAVFKGAYQMGVEGSEEFGIEPLGEAFMAELTTKSATRILKIMFNLGVFENPYTDPAYAKDFVGSAALNTVAYETHKKSVTMVKNSDGTLPLDSDDVQKVYATGIDANIVGRYFDVVSDPSEADFAIVQVTSPTPGQSGSVAQNLQFGPYTATAQREVSIGFDWYHADGTLVQYYETPNPDAGDYKSNRSRNGTTNNGNPDRLNTILNTVEVMDGKPVVLVLNMTNPMVVSEFEPYVDVMLIGNTTSADAYLEVITGSFEPSGLLSVNMPASMEAVELANEDAPHDMDVYVDADGNAYAFGFGLNYDGIISDERTERYPGGSTGISSGLKLSTDAYHVKPDGYANITTEFAQPVNSNTAIINYTFDTEKFEFADFHLSDGVQLISKEGTDTGAKVVVMIPSYNTQTYGRLAIHAKADAQLTKGWATVKAEVEYVVLGEDGDKTIKTATGNVAFTTVGPMVEGDTNDDGVVDLIDLSNMIDWFGIDNSDPEWDNWYTYFDFNNNGNIDIYDIVFVAQLIE